MFVVDHRKDLCVLCIRQREKEREDDTCARNFFSFLFKLKRNFRQIVNIFIKVRIQTMVQRMKLNFEDVTFFFYLEIMFSSTFRNSITIVSRIEIQPHTTVLSCSISHHLRHY